MKLLGGSRQSVRHPLLILQRKPQSDSSNKNNNKNNNNKNKNKNNNNNENNNDKSNDNNDNGNEKMVGICCKVIWIRIVPEVEQGRTK